MDNALLKEVQKIESEYKQITARRDDARAKVVEMLKKEKIDKVETEYGTFTVGKRSVWTYTDSVKNLEEKVKLAKIKEQQKGFATEGSTEYLVYTGV